MPEQLSVRPTGGTFKVQVTTDGILGSSDPIPYDADAGAQAAGWCQAIERWEAAAGKPLMPGHAALGAAGFDPEPAPVDTEMVAAPVARTVEELRAALADLPGDLPVAVGFDWGAGLDLDGVTVRGEHRCDPDCDSDCVIAGTVLLEVNPRPERH